MIRGEYTMRSVYWRLAAMFVFIGVAIFTGYLLVVDDEAGPGARLFRVAFFAFDILQATYWLIRARHIYRVAKLR